MKLTEIQVQVRYICPKIYTGNSMLENHIEFITFDSLSQTGMEKLTQASIQILDQLIEFASSITDEQYTRELPVLLNNSISKHYRHIIEFYGVMMEGFESGRVNYDNRKHDQELEQNRDKSVIVLEKLRNRFLNPILQEPIVLAGSYSLDSDNEFTISTNAEREIVYNIEHAIHHMAVIRIAVQHEFPELLIKDEFGFAFSTLKYLRKR